LTRRASAGAASTPRKSRAHPEDDIQRALFDWIALATPRIPQLAVAFHCPNGGRRDPREAARLKGLGVRAGVPDVMIPHPSPAATFEARFGPQEFVTRAMPRFYGLAIELKSEKGRETNDQVNWAGRLWRAGWMVKTCRSFDEARQTIADYFGVKP
jgi:hypothetical protein